MIKNVAVLGSGAMGHGIAQVMAQHGYGVSLYDINKDFLDRGVAKITESLKVLAGKGKISPEEMKEAISRIKTYLDLRDAVSGAGLVIEAIPESLEMKKNIFREICGYCPVETIMATNTSTISISGISEAVKNPGRFAGMHFFNPPGIMKLVEVIYGKDTSHETVDLICTISEGIGKVPVKVLKDRPGFIVNRVNAPTRPLLSAMLDEGKIKPDAVDAVFKKAGLKMGPYELMDFVGLDIVLSGMKYYEENLSPEWKPGRVIQDLVGKNRLGLKTGQGIYRWVSGRAEIDMDIETGEISPLDLDAVRLNEALKILKEGVAASAADIDRAMVTGMNAPRGPFAEAKKHDHTIIADTLNRLSSRYGLGILRPVQEIVDGSYKNMI